MASGSVGNKSTREIVVPGEVIGESPMKGGVGTYQKMGKIYSAILGIVQRHSGTIDVVPLEGKYIPKKGDVILGKCVDVSGTVWIIDINGTNDAPLLPMEVPWKVDFGDTRRYINIGDLLILKIKDVNERGHPSLTMKGEGLRKIRGGYLTSVSAVKVPRIIGKGGSMIKMIKRYTRCQIVVGKNGYIWINGNQDNTLLAEEVIHLIELHSQKIGLTTYVEEFLKSRSKNDVF